MKSTIERKKRRERKWFFLKYILLCCIPFLLSVKCGSKEGEEGVKAPFKPVSQTSTTVYELNTLSGGTSEAVMKYVGEAEFAGKTWEQYQVTYETPEGIKKVDFFGEYKGDGKVTAMGMRVSYPEGDLKPDYTVTLDEPLNLDVEAIPLDDEQEISAGATIEFEEEVIPSISIQATAKFKKTDDNATVESRFGTLSGVQVFEGKVTFEGGEGWSLLDLLKNLGINGIVWYHPTFGLLKAESPDWNIGTELTGEYDCGNLSASDYNTIQKVGVISTDNPQFVLSNYDCSGEFDGDKMHHAQMLLELRWADEERAKTSEQPNVEWWFETGWGYFPSMMVSSPASIFHPEENGKGYTFWYAFVDEGAKNEPGPNGILYQIRVELPSYLTNPVRVTGRIRYPIYHP